MFKIVAVSLHTDDLVLIQNIDGPVDPDSQRVTRFRFVFTGNMKDHFVQFEYFLPVVIQDGNSQSRSPPLQKSTN